jgi:chromosomal replication initiator protein
MVQALTPEPPSSFTSLAPQIQPQNIFDNFIIGESNRFAHAAALAVAESPASEYNPLFIYGGTGLGKTHLLHAVVNYIRATSTLRAIYTSSEQFTNEFIEMIRSDRRNAFRDRYRSTDILLIDDIQFLAGKVETQNEFFHTFNSLHQANKQIVIASDRSPKEIAALENRLRTRFEWGLLTDIQPPDLETRIAILRNKADRSALSVPPEVLEFIAHRISDNIRELEGALNRIAAYAKLEGKPITLDRAEDLLVGIGDVGTRQVTSDLIMRETAAAYDVTVEDLIGPSRRRPLVVARQVAMYLHRELTDLSLPRIGEIFGGRDHTTVLHAQRKIEELMHQRRQLLQQVNELANRIKLG